MHSYHWMYKRTQELIGQLTPSEISGSLGDLGTFIPLVVALARDRLIYLAPALFFSGISNVITGYMWDIPMCVQPMKSIAAVALNGDLTLQEVTTAGMLTGGLVFLLGISGLIEIVNWIIPFTVVSGMQIGLGLKLAGKGMKDIAELSWVSNMDCILLAIFCASFTLYLLRETKSVESICTSRNERESGHQIDNPSSESKSTATRPGFIFSFLNKKSFSHLNKDTKKAAVGVYLFLIGAIFAAIELLTTKNEDQQYDLPLRLFGAPVAVVALDDVKAHDWLDGFLDGALPQIPLTTLNSVISVCCLAHSLFPDKRSIKKGDEVRDSDAVVTRKEVAISVGLMNILFCPLGSIPNCHGAGGLAGQTAMGARGGSSVVFLGFAKIALAVFFGASALTLLDALPVSVLGVMLVIAGLELASTGLTLMIKDGNSQSLRSDSIVALVTASVILALNKTHYGAIAGWFTFIIYGDGFEQFSSWWTTRQISQVDDKPKESENMSSDGSISMSNEIAGHNASDSCVQESV